MTQSIRLPQECPSATEFSTLLVHEEQPHLVGVIGASVGFFEGALVGRSEGARLGAGVGFFTERHKRILG